MLLRRWMGSSPSPDPTTPASSSSALSSSTPPTTDPSILKYEKSHNGKAVTFKASKSAECGVVSGEGRERGRGVVTFLPLCLLSGYWYAS